MGSGNWKLEDIICFYYVCLSACDSHVRFFGPTSNAVIIVCALPKWLSWPCCWSPGRNWLDYSRNWFLCLPGVTLCGNGVIKRKLLVELTQHKWKLSTFMQPARNWNERRICKLNFGLKRYKRDKCASFESSWIWFPGASGVVDCACVSIWQRSPENKSNI